MENTNNYNNNYIGNENVGTTNNYIGNGNDKYEKERKVEQIADKLLERLKLPQKSRGFMCKTARKLPESTIWDNLEQALKGNNPPGLFIYLCKRDGV